ncbi:hypothetical protein DVA86_03550 [Streptomyces armeniacus]|uniref:Uncharacterized protein n=1 Tax=Streptomyces armeniacus TaxID=83291 RepID=A0A345XJP3_9ACTN|nr:hypothetical protein [Streptomyces armeniacus]AXK31859.1 hypothetical protein DVA86_03550 [Streptomyces armeniacus]
MSLYICSLIFDEDDHGRQEIPADDAYHVVRFPYGSRESYDVHNMHPYAQPDGENSSFPDARSGLIWPAAEGWGVLDAMVQWESGTYTEVRDQFVRDPLSLTDNPVDTTATDHRRPSPGMQCLTKQHSIFVHPGVPLGLRVAHNAGQPLRVVHAQFKLAIHTDVHGGS